MALGDFLSKLYGAASSVSPWYAALAVLALANLKTLPLGWHVRLLYSITRHLTFNKRPIPKSTPERLVVFQPSVYTTSTPMGEIDYFMHKSNSTYLSDLDHARGAHILVLFRDAFSKFKAEKKGPVFPALGGVTCVFKREIKPYVKYEVWSRVLTWDNKWIFVVSHFVKAGAVRPQGFLDQPWKKGSKKRTPKAKVDSKVDTQTASVSTAQPHPAIYCTCVTKYVMKQGRKTLRPDEFLRAAGLIPNVTDSTDDSSEDGKIVANIEKRRKEGLAIAESFITMDAAHDWFDGQDETAFALYE